MYSLVKITLVIFKVFNILQITIKSSIYLRYEDEMNLTNHKDRFS